MMKPKVALVKSGFLPAGSENKRGRLSADAIAECKRLVAEEGYKIEGYEVSSTPASEKDAPVVQKKSVDPNRILDVPDEARSEDAWEAHTSEGPVGMRTVCNTCHSSLTYCHCAPPMVWVAYDRAAAVYFKPRTRPLNHRKW